MNTASLNTGLLTGLHLMVDGLCACGVFMLMSIMEAEHITLLFVLYNVLAFMTQPLFGGWLDRVQKRNAFFHSSMALLLMGAGVSAFSITSLNEMCAFVGTTFLGLGNALFHVYGGKSVAVSTHNDMRHLGIFVSSGAVGLVIGEQLRSLVTLPIIVLVMLVLSYLLLKRCPHEVTQPDECTGHDTSSDSRNTSIGLFLFILLLVFMRSFVGKVVPAAEMDVVLYAVLIGTLAFAGKSLGGFLGKRWGVWHTLTATFLLSGICLLLSFVHVAFHLGMVLCINLTMPLTLYLANRQMPHREGFAFGMLAAVLIPGFALGTLWSGSYFTYLWLFALVATIVIEVSVLLFIREHRWQVLSMAVVMNILTNVPLNLFFLSHTHLHDSMPTQLALEGVVFIVESLLYLCVLHDIRKAITYAFLCNAISYLSGLLLSTL